MMKKNSKLIVVILVGLLCLVVAMPTNKSSSTDTDKTELEADAANYYESKLDAILENSYGKGNIEVMVSLKKDSASYDFYGTSSKDTYSVEGVLIVAAIADSQAEADIIHAVCSLFDLDAHKVAVICK